MMTIEEIRALMSADESRALELKKTTGELTLIMHVAFFRSAILERVVPRPLGINRNGDLD